MATTQNENPQNQNTEIVEPQENDQTMETQELNLTQEQLNNLASKFDSHIQVQNDQIVDTLNNVTLQIETDDRNVYVSNAFEKSYKVEKRLLESDEMKQRKARNLANKTTQLITHAISSSKWNEVINSDIEKIESGIKSKANKLGKYNETRHLGDNQYVAKFETGKAFITKDSSGNFTITEIDQFVAETLKTE